MEESKKIMLEDHLANIANPRSDLNRIHDSIKTLCKDLQDTLITKLGKPIVTFPIPATAIHTYHLIAQPLENAQRCKGKLYPYEPKDIIVHVMIHEDSTDPSILYDLISAEAEEHCRRFFSYDKLDKKYTPLIKAEEKEMWRREV